MSSGVSSDEEGFFGLHLTQNKMNQEEMESADLRAIHGERT